MLFKFLLLLSPLVSVYLGAQGEPFLPAVFIGWLCSMGMVTLDNVMIASRSTGILGAGGAASLFGKMLVTALVVMGTFAALWNSVGWLIGRALNSAFG